MQYWYGYTGEGLILGHGRAIRQVVPQSQALQGLLDSAYEYYARYAAISQNSKQAVDAQTFAAALLSPLAVQELWVSSPSATPFSSAGQVLRLFEDVNIEQAAINLFNGRITSAYAETGDRDAIAERIAHGFANGDLLVLPRDAKQLHVQEVLNTLPGVLVFLLSLSLAERKAFDGYLRRGTPPAISDSQRVSLAKSRPVLRTWEREARLLKEFLTKGCSCIDHQ